MSSPENSEVSLLDVVEVPDLLEQLGGATLVSLLGAAPRLRDIAKGLKIRIDNFRQLEKLSERLSTFTVDALDKDLIGYGKSAILVGNFKSLWIVLNSLQDATSINQPHGACGHTLLDLATRRMDYRAVKLLFTHGATATVVDCTQHTPLHHAARNGHIQLVATLTKVSDVNAQNKWGKTPLHIAAEKGHADCVRFLIERGANVNIEGNVYQNTPLHMAAEKGHLACVELLVKTESINLRNRLGYSPLHLAAMGGHAQCVTFLIDQGANVNNVANNLQTPLRSIITRIRDQRYSEVHEILIIHGAVERL